MGQKYHTTPLATFSHIALTINHDPKDLPALLGFLTNLQIWFTTFPFFCVPKANCIMPENTLLVKNTNNGINSPFPFIHTRPQREQYNQQYFVGEKHQQRHQIYGHEYTNIFAL